MDSSGFTAQLILARKLTTLGMLFVGCLSTSILIGNLEPVPEPLEQLPGTAMPVMAVQAVQVPLSETGISEAAMVIQAVQACLPETGRSEAAKVIQAVQARLPETVMSEAATVIQAVQARLPETGMSEAAKVIQAVQERLSSPLRLPETLMSEAVTAAVMMMPTDGKGKTDVCRSITCSILVLMSLAGSVHGLTQSMPLSSLIEVSNPTNFNNQVKWPYFSQNLSAPILDIYHPVITRN
jgi:hypothetical protein